MKIIFSHGKEGSPNGSKSKILKKVAEDLRHDFIAIDFTNCKDAAARVDLLKKELRGYADEQIVLVGSSMGGYVSASVSNEYETAGLFLIAPALYLRPLEYEVQHFECKAKNILVRHGWDDELIPPENSIKFCKQHNAALIIEKDNHRMSETKDSLKRSFEDFLIKINTNN